MDIHFHCGKCQQSLVVEESGAGLEIVCPKCEQMVLVPSSTTNLDAVSQVIQTSPQDDNQFENGKAIPRWNNSWRTLAEASIEQREFYSYWLREYENGNVIPLDSGNLGYLKAYLYEAIRQFIQDKDIGKLETCFAKSRQAYPSDYAPGQDSLTWWRSDAYVYLKDYEKAWQLRTSVRRGMLEHWEQRFMDILKIRAKCADTSIDGASLLSWTRFGLTKFGIENRKEVGELLSEYLNEFQESHGKNFLEYSCSQCDLSNPDEINPELLIKFGIVADMEDYKSLSAVCEQHGQDAWKPWQLQLFVGPYTFYEDDEHPIPCHVPYALKEQVGDLIRHCENRLREMRDLPRVGEGWISEAELFQKLRESFPEEQIIRHARPDWLAPQHLDIYLPVRKVGIEYQGKQHYEPVEYFGGAAAHEELKKRDERKRKLCEEHGCKLIYVSEGYQLENVKASLEHVMAGGSISVVETLVVPKPNRGAE